MKLEEAEVLITFDLEALGKDGLRKLFEVERLLSELGVHFDTGSGCGGRDWEFDWSLQGPVKVLFRKLVKDDPVNRYVRQNRKPAQDQSSQGDPSEASA
ncbi:hypothetical protein LCGC14_1264340 [marine sediment metagenome]|uniref:Uncharacterized protein n=1 Tax=marine sediment metagenome TaxID=412755 RepID=A0A0F9NGP8_9ZZZZ